MLWNNAFIAPRFLGDVGSLGAGSYPYYATRFGEESMLFSHNRGRRSGWLESFSWLRSMYRATRPGFFFCFFFSSHLFSSSFLFPWVARGARTVRRRDICRCIVAATMNDGHSSPPWWYRCCHLPTYVYYTNSHLQHGRSMPRHVHKLHVS